MPISAARRCAWLAISLFILLVGAAGAASCSAQSWPDERTAGPFHCHADFSLRDQEALLAEIGSLRKDVCRTLALQESEEPIHLFLFQHKARYAQYVHQYFPSAPDRRALFIKNRGPGMVFAHWHREFDVDVRHECTHAVLHASLPMVPLWLDEGLAEYFETRRERRAYESPHLNGVRWQAKLGICPSLSKLEQLSDLSQMGATEYRSAWAWTHFLLHGSDAAYDELVLFLRDIEGLTPPGQLSERVRRRVPDVERQFIQHFRSWSPSS